MFILKELLNEYQSVLITSIAAIFVFICLYTALPTVVSKTETIKNKASKLEFIEKNIESTAKLEYPKGDKIRFIKGAEFRLSDYITVNDLNLGNICNYSYSLYVNGVKSDKFDTNTPGGYHLMAEINYKKRKIFGELLVIIEER